MKHFIIFTFIIICTVSIYGQELQFKQIDTCKSIFSKQQYDSIYYDLTPIQSSSYQIHFRISLPGQIIDLFSNDGKNYQGLITNHTIEYGYQKAKKHAQAEIVKKQIVFEKSSILKSNVDSIINTIINSKQNEIPTDTLIPNWYFMIFDCASLNFEFKKGNVYNSQRFFCPWSQNDSIAFKHTIIENYNTIREVLQLDSLYDSFTQKLPKGITYSFDGYMMMYISTDQETENWEKYKPKRNYLKTIKDTVDNYINHNLDSIQTTWDQDEIKCYGSYFLTFGRNGKLKEIWIHPISQMKISDGISFYIEDKIEIHRCKKNIKRIFKQVDLKNFNLEYELQRTFYVGLNNEWAIRDDTIY